MNPLLRKEVRLVLPAWLGAMALAIVPVWLLWPAAVGVMPQSPGVLVFAPYLLGVLLLGITPFAQELNWGTFAVQLSQPVERRRLWRIKLVLLGAGLCLAFVALCLASHFRMESILDAMKDTVWRDAFRGEAARRSIFLRALAEVRQDTLRECLTFGGLGMMGAFAGGLWAPLLLRQTSAALWVAFVIPMGLVLLTGAVLGSAGDTVLLGAWFAVMAAYLAASFHWGRRLFFDWQDAQWTGGIVSLSVARSPATAGTGTRSRKPWRALLRKELQSQQVNLLLAAGLLLLHLAVLLIRGWSARYLAVHRTLAMTLESFPLLWLAMPLLVGSVAVAEERKLGTLESFECLPAGRRRQFLLKLGLVAVLGVFLGGVVPLWLETAAERLGLKPGGSTLFVQGEMHSVVFILLLGAGGLALLALYASTLCRSTLQALGAGLLGSVVATLVLILFAHPPGLGDVILWRGPLVLFIGWPVMILVLLRLGYRNYRTLLPSGALWLKNAVVLLLALAAIACVTSVTYHRLWEIWLPEEPRHEVLSGRSWLLERGFKVKPKIASSFSRTAVVLPDGRLWLRERQVRLRQVLIGTKRVLSLPGWPGRWHAGYIPGTNWRDAAVSHTGCFAIQDDGTLWDLSGWVPGHAKSDSNLERVGDGHDWRTISGGGLHFSAIKSDGTLWEWEKRPSGFVSAVAGGAGPVPRQVGSDPDWIAVADSLEGSAAVKSDGSIWRWRITYQRNPNGGWAVQRTEQPQKWLTVPNGRPVSLSYEGYAAAVLCADGSIWVGGALNYFMIGRNQLEQARGEMVRLNTAPDWSQFAFGLGEASGIRRNGSLWEWEMRSMLFFGRWSADAIPPSLASNYGSWIAVGVDGSGFLALAADGKLCQWGDPDEPDVYRRFDPRAGGFLARSRIKARTVAEFLP